MSKGKTLPSLNLFDFDDLPEIDNATLAAAGAKLAEATERSRALREDLVFPATKETPVCPYGCCEGGVCPEWPCNKPEETTSATQPGFWAARLQEMGEMRLLAARSFIELARRSGIEHEAVTPTGTDSNGHKTYNLDAVTRLANLMRGKPESLKPELKTEADWQAAIEGLKAWKEGGKSCLS